MQLRVAIYRWGWIVAALIALTAALELRRSAESPQASVSPYAILDHVPLRRVTLGSRDAEAPESYHPPKLTVRSEKPYYFGHTVGGFSPLPPWVEPQHGDQPVSTFHGELDGSWIAIAGTTVILIDRDHHAEVGLEFRWFRMFPPRHDSDGDDRLYVIEAHRVGSRLIAYGMDPQGGPFLASIDIATGLSVWAVQLNADSVPGFAVTHGVAVTSEYMDEHAVLVERELVSGRIVATVPTSEGQYTLEARADGSLHGVIEALAWDGYTSEIDVAVE